MNSVDPDGGGTGLERLPCEIDGFDVWASRHEVVVKKHVATFGEWCTVVPFAIAAPVMGIVAALTALMPAFCALWPRPEYDMPLWLAIIWPIIFFLGAGVCFWGFKCILIVLLPVARRIMSSPDGATCESSVWGFTYGRKTLQRPLVLVADVYDSRGVWTCHMYLRGADRRKYPLTVPTGIASSKARATRAVNPLAEAVANRIEASITGLGQDQTKA